MFILIDNPTFRHTVTAMVPVDGGHREETFDVTYRVLDPEAVEGLDLGSAKDVSAFLRKAVVSLDDIAGVDKKPIPYSDELRELLFKRPYARKAMLIGYLEALGKGRAGN